MAVDIPRGIQAAIAAAFDDGEQERPKRPHLSTGRALLLGACLSTAGRLLMSPRGRELLGSFEQWLEDEVGQLTEGEEEPTDEDYDELEDEIDEDYDEAGENYDEPDDDEGFDDEPEPPRMRRKATARGRR
jgi:hypothetical protein